MERRSIYVSIQHLTTARDEGEQLLKVENLTAEQRFRIGETVNQQILNELDAITERIPRMFAEQLANIKKEAA